jgi:hypothetical protein
MDDNTKECCKNCKFLEIKSHKLNFCRLNPPIPVVVTKKTDSGEKKFIESKFPIIEYPEIDYCSHFKNKKLL